MSSVPGLLCSASLRLYDLNRYFTCCFQFYAQAQFAAKSGFHGSYVLTVDKYLVLGIVLQSYSDLGILVTFYDELHTVVSFLELQYTGSGNRFI